MKILNQQDWVVEVQKKLSGNLNYAVMYSSLLDAATTNSECMMIPVDDHMVHRGDGVFEALKFIKNKIYLVDEHLHRLFHSAAAIGIDSPKKHDEIKIILQQLVQISNLPTGLLRVFLSRGHGDFTANPYSTKGPQLNIIVTKLIPMAEEKYATGASIGKSMVVAKNDFFSRIKSCNYLPNVLMKKEAVDSGYDFMIGVDEAGCFLESSTENIIYLDRQDRLVRPPLKQILRGCTMMRALELAKQISGVKAIEERPTKFEELFNAKEIMMVGTTIDVLPVTHVEEEPIGSGEVGEIAIKLRELVRQDQVS